ncbi:MAG: hypothetical protein V4498_10080, partial [candidate division FCPU426 bacterium]
LEKFEKVRKVSLREEHGDDVATYELETNKTGDLRAGLAAAVVKKGWDLLEMRYVGLALEDIFLQLITSEGDPLPSIQNENEVAA